MTANLTTRFILGRAGSGKTQLILDRVDEMLRTDPLGAPIFVIVPDQATLLYERVIACRRADMVTTRLRVMGFRQFGRYVLECVGGASVPEVNALGRQLLITRLLLQSADQLSHYKQSVTQPGLPDVIDRLFGEFEETGKSLEDLDSLIADLLDADPTSTLASKLKDLRLLYPKYHAALGSERLDQHLRGRQICAAIKNCTELDGAYLAVDAFDDLRPSECRMLACCAARGMTLDVSLLIDPRDKAAINPDETIRDEDPFRRPRRTFKRLVSHLRAAGIGIETKPLTTAPRFKSKSIEAIESHFLAGRRATIEHDAGVKMVNAPSRQAEIDHAARFIRQQVADGMRYRDIALIVRSIEDYGDAIESSFRAHDIPNFVDRVRLATHHPLVQLVLSLLRPTLSTLRSASLIDVLKSELTSIDRPTIEQLQLYVETRGIEGETWRRDSAWKIDQSEDEENARRDFDASTLHDLDEARRTLLERIDGWLKITNTTATVGDFVRSLHTTLVELGVDQTISRWIATAELETGNAHHEVWTRLMELFEQLVDVLGSESMSFDDFAPLLRAGLSGFSFAIAPSTIDQVIVGSVDRTRLGPVKLVIVLGLADGTFPARHDSTTNLHDHERRALSEQQWDIGPDSRMRLLDELLLAYETFSLPSEQLVISRPQFDESGRELPPSSFWRRLQTVLPDLKPTTIDPGAPESLGSFDQMIRALLLHVRATQGDFSPVFSGIYELIRTRADLKSRALKVLPSLIYKNEAKLAPDVVSALYESKLIKGSVSRLETYAACPFKHFARSTLGLDEQTTPALTRLELGSAYHGALENLFKRIIKGEHSIDDDLAPILTSLSQSLAGELEARVAIDESRSLFVQSSFDENLNDVITRQRRTIRAGSLRPRRVEMSFGLDPDDGGPLEIKTPKGRTVALRGKIDRIDVHPAGSELVTLVIDYKLTTKALSWVEAQAGLALQLMTYLLVLSERGAALLGQNVQSAGALFVRITRQIRSKDHPDLVPDPTDPEYWNESTYKPRGLINAAQLAVLDREFDGKKSVYFVGSHPGNELIGYKSDIISEQAMEAILQWTRQKLGELADEIADGNIQVKPYRLGNATPCSSCAFRAVCRFDRRINRYYEIESKDQRVVVGEMVKGGQS